MKSSLRRTLRRRRAERRLFLMENKGRVEAFDIAEWFSYSILISFEFLVLFLAIVESFSLRYYFCEGNIFTDPLLIIRHVKTYNSEILLFVIYSFRVFLFRVYYCVITIIPFISLVYWLRIECYFVLYRLKILYWFCITTNVYWVVLQSIQAIRNITRISKNARNRMNDSWSD